ncbi:WD40 repeat-like protein [Gonapodya prolifera JEL478]|uniref:WD40 repeat-like protein n=1 Tax=Gonapodya prolifera (strain JEL478) TaxID=1344416 RepID=A0A139A7T1_GONPJ|nr:WD40 repeat-like protein [Gonapodya prolifera JEL478]|eukprot:KXS12817.1 WD40 repeat-like protein [Gonapodya prolifera JEL478]
MADQQAILQELARKRRARTLAVPTDDNRVKARLRDFGEPICLFGEGPGDRRERLRDVMARKVVEEEGSQTRGRGRAVSVEVEDEDEDEEIVEEFYTPGPEELLEARTAIAQYSLPRARARIAEQRAEIDIPFPQRKKIRHEFYTEAKSFSIFSSQVADDRPASVCAFAPGSRFFATGGWSGLVKLWTVPGSERVWTWKGHKDRVSGIAFHPHATMPNHAPTTVALASCSSDSTINLYSLRQSTPLATLEGHVGRVARVAFHPSGRWLASTGFDTTWRLWDVERQEEMVEQEGHAREVYAIGFQGDGALVGTAGFDSHARIWDLRSGRSITNLSGHVRPILSLDFDPNGYTVATGGEDNTVRIWDLRTRKCIYTIAAHENLVSSVRFWKGRVAELGASFGGAVNGGGDHAMNGVEAFAPDDHMRRQQLDGSFLVTTSYDGTVKLWTEGDWKCLRVMQGHEGKVMDGDVSGGTCRDLAGCDLISSLDPANSCLDGRFIGTVGFDRTFKLWTREMDIGSLEV